jgi:hypothetical protein
VAIACPRRYQRRGEDVDRVRKSVVVKQVMRAGPSRGEGASGYRWIGEGKTVACKR